MRWAVFLCPKIAVTRRTCYLPVMRILALEPFYTGSHRAFLDGWVQHSRHEFTCLTLPGRLWKWRMRHAAYSFAEMIAAVSSEARQWDVVFASSMLNLAEFRGLVSPDVARLPAVLYFHENQLTYPVREERERDLHFAFTNLMSVMAADAVWFNSAFHRREFRHALHGFMERMPDFIPKGALIELDAKSSVQHPGHGLAWRSIVESSVGPMRIAWVSRWEHDKNPDLFFHALFALHEAGIPFELTVLGEAYREKPEIFETARRVLRDEIVHWGYVEAHSDFAAHLYSSDVVVSTAYHEFFGIAVVEAMAAGCYPLLPNRLAYPELLDSVPVSRRREFLYDGTRDDLVRKLKQLALMKTERKSLFEAAKPAQDAGLAFHWMARARQMDRAVSGCVPQAGK